MRFVSLSLSFFVLVGLSFGCHSSSKTTNPNVNPNAANEAGLPPQAAMPNPGAVTGGVAKSTKYRMHFSVGQAIPPAESDSFRINPGPSEE